MIAHVKIALLATAVVALVAACAARSAELKTSCVEVASVTGQPFFECRQKDDASITVLQNKWLEKPDFRLRRAEDLGSLVVVPKAAVETPLPPRFETPYWVPNEATKQRALKRAYELNGNISNDPVVTGRTVITPETEFNVLDMQAAGATPVTDPCEKHGMRRVEINDDKGWRCRK